MAPRVVVLSVTQCALGPSSLPGIVCQPKPPHACDSSNTLVPRGSSVRTLTADPAGGWGAAALKYRVRRTSAGNIAMWSFGGFGGQARLYWDRAWPETSQEPGVWTAS
ncbi:hypothetical protein Bbelb_357510 [Branchiostoma belcheri]|nr:hypothetical protein Bbelb_357510 [Branchiostoma belcheri]